MPYTYLLGVGLAFAFLDGFGIGANDNANNFANAVASKVVTPLQAVIIAAIFEFLGALLVGNNVAEAIRGRIINVSLFRSNPATLQLAMVCALMGSSTWLMVATRIGMPVSTTHSIIGAVLGVGVSAFGPGAINWEYGSGRGFGGIVASWFISIAVSGVMASTLYLIMRFSILRYKNSFARSLVFGPIVFGLTYGIMSLALVWKGTPKLKLDKIPDSDVIAIVLGVWAVTSVLSYFWVSIPLWRFHWNGENFQWWHYVLGPFAPKCSIRPDFDASHQLGAVTTLFNSELDDGYARAQAEIRDHNIKVAEAARARIAAANGASAPAGDIETASTAASTPAHIAGGDKAASKELALRAPDDELAALRAKLAVYQAKENTPRKAWFRQWKEDFAAAGLAGKAYLLARYLVCFGIDGREVTEAQGVDSTHLNFAPRWESNTEKFYVSLNVISSCIQAFAHGSNDVANAIGPLSTIYFVWANNRIPGSSAPVEIWQLAFGGAAIVLGLALYGYNIMRALGNNLTYQSPSRGFCMDVGSAITILIASKEGFPISTTQCITGATVGVGIANGELKAVNWWLFAKIFASWIVTLPVAGTLSGVIYAFVAFSPTQPHNPNNI